MATSSRGTPRPIPADVPDVPGVVFGRMRYGRIGRRLRARPILVDTALALTVCLFALVPLTLTTGPTWRIFLLTCAAVAPLCVRRRYPIGALVVCAAVSYTQIVLWVPSFGTFSSLLIAFYTVAKWSPRRPAIGAAVAMTVWIIWFSVRLPHVRDIDKISVILVLLPAAVAAGVLGVNANTRRAYVASIADRAVRAERERDQQALLAAAGERARIAREMHDIVAHNLSVMIALADGASYTLRDLVESHPAPPDPTAPAAARSDPARPDPAASDAAGSDAAGSDAASPDRAHGDDRAERAARAVESVSSTGREALAQMRSLLGVLRDDGGLPRPTATAADVAPRDLASRDLAPRDAAPRGLAPRDAAPDAGGLPADSLTAPQPRVADLDRLVNQVRHAGRTVGFLVAGQPRELPADAELTVYRIVQEALTNVLKHAAPRSRALVRLAFDAAGVEVEITDSVPDPAAGAAEPARERHSPGPWDVAGSPNLLGRGIQGMRERAALHDGHLVAGPTAGPDGGAGGGAGGGWRVHARINAPAAHRPTPAPPAPRSDDRRVPGHDAAVPTGRDPDVPGGAAPPVPERGHTPVPERGNAAVPAAASESLAP